MFFKRKYKSNNNVKTKSFKFLPIFSIFIIIILFGFSNSYDKSWNFDWSRIRPEVKDSILKVKSYGNLVTSISEDNSSYNQIRTQGWIFKNARIKELIKLTDFPNPQVKALSYNIILKKKKIDKFFFLRKALKDSLSFVQLSGGCLYYKMHLGEYLLKHQLGFGLKRHPRITKIEAELTIEEIQEITKLYNLLKQNEDKYKQAVYGEEHPITGYVWE